MASILYVAETVDSVRSKIVGYAQAGKLLLTNWIAGGVGQQLLETVAQTIASSTSVTAAAIRGFASLDTSVDPGDVDPYDPTNVTLPASPGFLSAYGEGTWGTTRIGETFATGTINFTLTPGTGVNPVTIPGRPSFTFQSEDTNSDGVNPTYVNSNTSPITIGVGATVAVPVEAEVAGTSYNADANRVTILNTTTPGASVTNPSPILGLDRQDADSYREACREAAALTSPDGPADSYRYLATTGRDDGTWGQSTTGNPLGISKVYASQDSSSGIVVVYYAGPAGGAAISGSVAMANQIISTTPGVIACPDAITFSGQAAIDVPINVTAVVKFKAKDVGYAAGSYGPYTIVAAAPAGLQPLFLAIYNAYVAWFEAEPIGGDDQDSSGNGVVYTEDFRGVLYGIELTPGIVLRAYDAVVTTPSASTTALATGHVATPNTISMTVVLA